MSDTAPDRRTIPAEPYPELLPVLRQFVEGARNALKENFVGAYLVGSLAVGDFDLDSDVDFLIVIEQDLTSAEVELLRELHLKIHGLGCYPAQHLEGSYLPRSVLGRNAVIGTQPLWYIDNGSKVLQRSTHDNRWHVRWILRERGIMLYGPDPRQLLQPVTTEMLQCEIVPAIEKLSACFLAELQAPVQYFNTRFGQSSAVLTCCRMMYTFQHGVIVSKRASAQWAEQSLHPQWHALIQQAWLERDGVRFGAKVRQAAASTLLLQTARFIEYVRNEIVATVDKSQAGLPHQR